MPSMEQQPQEPVMGYPITQSSFQNPPRPPPKPCTCSKRICILSLIAIVVVGSIVFLTAPTHSKMNFEIDSVHVHPFNISISSQITANWSLVFSDTGYVLCHFGCRRNDESRLEDIEVSILYKNESISYMTINSPLIQYNKKEHKRLTHANIDVSSSQINGTIADAIVDDLTSHGAINTTVTVKAIVEFTGQDSDSLLMTASCENVIVGFSSDKMTGTMFGGSRTCKTSLVDMK